MNDQALMSRALRLASLGRHASPNPMVGCVIAAPDGRILGEGFHERPGKPHAEAMALSAAKDRDIRGATAYVTLEPCSHFGRTPPCATALREAGIARVVAAMQDPDRRVSGNGFGILRDAGIEVSVGVLEERARALNAAYIKHRTTATPWCIVKTAMTLDGKIATAAGQSRWISSSVSRRAAHRQFRDRCDAIVVGIGTVLADDPLLTTRLTHRAGRDPWRIVVDSRLRTPLTAAVVHRAALDGRTIIATTDRAEPGALAELERAGCSLLICSGDWAGHVDIRDFMRRLGTRGDMITILVEGGGELAFSFFQAECVDRMVAYVAPIVFGGRAAPGPVGGVGIGEIADASRIRVRSVRRSGPDIVIDGSIG